MATPRTPRDDAKRVPLTVILADDPVDWSAVVAWWNSAAGLTRLAQVSLLASFVVVHNILVRIAPLAFAAFLTVLQAVAYVMLMTRLQRLYRAIRIAWARFTIEHPMAAKGVRQYAFPRVRRKIDSLLIRLWMRRLMYLRAAAVAAGVGVLCLVAPRLFVAVAGVAVAALAATFAALAWQEYGVIVAPYAALYARCAGG